MHWKPSFGLPVFMSSGVPSLCAFNSPIGENQMIEKEESNDESTYVFSIPTENYTHQ